MSMRCINPFCLEDVKTIIVEQNIKQINISLPGLGLSQINAGLRHYLWPKTDVEPVLAAERRSRCLIVIFYIGCESDLCRHTINDPLNVIFVGTR